MVPWQVTSKLSSDPGGDAGDAQDAIVSLPSGADTSTH